MCSLSPSHQQRVSRTGKVGCNELPEYLVLSAEVMNTTCCMRVISAIVALPSMKVCDAGMPSAFCYWAVNSTLTLHVTDGAGYGCSLGLL